MTISALGAIWRWPPVFRISKGLRQIDFVVDNQPSVMAALEGFRKNTATCTKSIFMGVSMAKIGCGN
jgi:hypothetical protein